MTFRATVVLAFVMALTAAAQDGAANKPAVIKVVKKGAGGWELQRNGEPYVIRGAVASDRLEELKAAGGNSIRTWGSLEKDPPLYDKARALGLTVCAGLWLAQRDVDGLDYSDAAAVKAQLEKMRAYVRTHKDNPAILLWAVGYETQRGGDVPEIWKAIDDVARMIHEEDSNHPTLTIVPGPSAEAAAAVKKNCPHIDMLGIACFAAVATLSDVLAASGWDKPVIVAEFGGPREWETAKTLWGAPVAMTSTAKAAHYLEGYRKGIEGAKGKCLGSYVSWWGSMRPTQVLPGWQDMFLSDGTRLGAVAAMEEAWTGNASVKRPPAIMGFQSSAKEISVAPGSKHTAKAEVTNPDEDDAFRVRWEIRAEPTAGQDDPTPVSGCFAKAEGMETEFTAPLRDGAYRLYVTVRGLGGAAVATIPFEVKGVQ